MVQGCPNVTLLHDIEASPHTRRGRTLRSSRLVNTCTPGFDCSAAQCRKQYRTEVCTIGKKLYDCSPLYAQCGSVDNL